MSHQGRTNCELVNEEHEMLDNVCWKCGWVRPSSRFFLLFIFLLLIVCIILVLAQPFAFLKYLLS